MSDYPLCPARQRLTVWGSDGSKQYNQRCTEQTAEKANQDVSPSDCLDCPVRALIVRDDSRHPPAKKVRDDGNRADLRPDKGGGGWPKCDKRLIMRVANPCSTCSKTVNLRLCNCDLTPHYGGKVSKDICKACPFRSNTTN